MRCRVCGKDYPSLYHFKTADTCLSCYEGLSEEERTKAAQPSPISRMTTTAFTLDGYRIVKSFGVIRGITVRSRSVFGTIGASLQTIVGGNITLFSELCEQARAEAFEMMIAHAVERGANAVIGVRYDATEVIQGATEVLCYGTAVLVEPEGVKP
ncbi:MAG: YbjQ family protein [Candidatus Aminicenantales bacterium]